MDDKARALRAFLIASDLTREQLIDALLAMGKDAAGALVALEQARALSGLPLTQAATLAAGVPPWLDQIVTPAREMVAEAEAARRRANSAKGAPQPVIPADELLAFLADWQALHGKARGSKKAAAAHFGVTDGGIRAALQRIEREKNRTG